VGVPKKNPPGFFGYVPGCLNPDTPVAKRWPLCCCEVFTRCSLARQCAGRICTWMTWMDWSWSRAAQWRSRNAQRIRYGIHLPSTQQQLNNVAIDM